MLKNIFKRKTEYKYFNYLEEIDNFNSLFYSLLNKDQYLSKKESLFLLQDKFESFYKKLKNFESTSSLNKPSFKSKKNNENILKFIRSYEEIETRINIHNREFIEKHLKEDEEYLNDILKNVDPMIRLDEDQRKVVLSDEDYTLVIAGAGAGKTTTVAAKVKYLVEKKNIDPREILVISYTNKAVNELRERIQNQLKIDAIITTFHSTGNAILYKHDDERKRVIDSGVLYKISEKYLKEDILTDPEMVNKVILFFGSYFDAPYEGDDLNEFFTKIARSDFSTLKSNMDEYSKEIIDSRSKKRISIKQEILRSFEEVEIANFLYLNNIEYSYEPIYKYHINDSYKLYTPDFLIRQGEKVAYIEHFGITENGQNDMYSKEELELYLKAVKDKTLLHKKHNTSLIITYSKYDDNRGRLIHLEEKLLEKGFLLKKRDSKEVFEKLVNTEENKYITRFNILLTKFIQNFKVNGYSSDDFEVMKSRTKNVRTKLFLDIAKGVFLSYQIALHKNNLIDFEDMINDSARILREKLISKEKLGFKYIIVDEYQDISMQRFNLTKELSQITDAKIIAVGDDWQSIYAFSGSNITLFTDFIDTVGYANEMQITKTYRNAQEVIDIAGGFIQQNKSQIEKRLISPKSIEKPIIVITYLDDYERMKIKGLKGIQLEKAKAVDYTLSLINQTIVKKDHKVLLIGRYNFDGERLGQTELFSYNNETGAMSSKNYPHITLEFMSAHSSKGLGYDDVIVINMSNEVFGFPAQIEVDPVLNLVIKNDKSIEYAEERRLFYVALTRTKNRVFLATPETRPSEFVLEIIKDYESVVQIGDFNVREQTFNKTKVCPLCGYPLTLRYNPAYGLKLYMCTNEPEVCDFISNDLKGGTMTIGKCPSCVDGYLIVKSTKKTNVSFLGCTNYLSNNKGCNFTVSQLLYDKEIKTKQPKRRYSTIKNDILDAQIKGEIKGTVKISKPKIIKEADVKDENRYIEMFNELKDFRMEYAKTHKKLPFLIFPDKTIHELIKIMPKNIEELRNVFGLGPVKINEFGNDLIRIVNKYLKRIVPKEYSYIENEKMLYGRKWTFEEDQQLVDEVRRGLSIKEIANIHERTLGAIKSRIKKIMLEDKT